MAAPIFRMPNPSLGGHPIDVVNHNGVVVIVGANGSGKSRLGTWLEDPGTLAMQRGGPAPNRERHAYRIGAQRVLALPEQAARLPSDQANDALIAGGQTPGLGGWSRLQGDPVVGQSNDFGALVNALFAERDKLAADYYAAGKSASVPLAQASKDSLDRLGELWAEVFRGRTLDIGDHTIFARSSTSVGSYSATNLSDGERVGFYLIGHALMAPPSARIVIDEPELHLHPSIQATLWTRLEEARPDCLFVYITHDLAFAASRVGAPIVVLFDYAAPAPEQLQHPHGPARAVAPFPGHWKWQIAPRADLIPPEVSLQILGSRRSTLFVEGDRNSLDLPVYEALFPEKLIIPAGNCENVSKATVAFQKIPSLHHIDPSGLIDRDDRTDKQVRRLRSSGIYTLPVGGVENLLALPESIRAYMDSIEIPPGQQEDRLHSAQWRAWRAMKQLRNQVIAERAQYIVRRRLQSVVRDEDSLVGLNAGFARAIENARPEVVFMEVQALVDAALQSHLEFVNFLAVFRNKGILTCIAREFRVSRSAYRGALISLLHSNAALRTSIREKIGILPQVAVEEVVVENLA